MIGYLNISHSIGTVVSSRLATLHELETVYGMDDLHDFIEILAVDSHNQRIANERRD